MVAQASAKSILTFTALPPVLTILNDLLIGSSLKGVYLEKSWRRYSMTTLKNLLLAPLGAVLIALETAGAVQAAQFFGDPQPLGEGFVRSFVTLDDYGNPSEVGATLTQGSLSLPTGDSEPDIATVLSLPPEASATVFNHLVLTYRPHTEPGNPPAFGVPRITIDSSLLSLQERALICPNPDTTGPQPTCAADEQAKILKPPKPGTVPQGMLPTGIVEPGIGTRYFDPDAALPIIMGQQSFNTLYDYGFYDGEPSVIAFGASKAFLETQPNVTNPIKVPTSYPKSGYYPTEYSVTFDATSQEYNLSLSGLTYRSVPEPSFTWGLLGLVLWGVVSLRKNKLKQQKLAHR